MATTTLRADSAHVTPTTGALIADCMKHANELESIIAEIRAVLHAIGDGDLLAALPENEEDARRHNTGTWLLQLAENRLDSIKGFGDELSAKLGRLSSGTRQEAA